MKQNKERSREVCLRIRAGHGECFANSLHAAALVDGTYVEGFAVIGGWLPMPIAHGWVEVDGEIVDCTPSYCEDDREQVYFPVLRLSPGAALRRAGKRGTLPIADLDLLDDRETRRAYFRAYREALGDQWEAAAKVMGWSRFPEAEVEG